MQVRAQFKMAMDKAELASSEAPVEAGVQRLNVNVSAVFERNLVSLVEGVAVLVCSFVHKVDYSSELNRK